MKPTSITLRKEDAGLNMRRQYSISVERDLFGAPLVVCRWGRIGQGGQRREHVCSNATEARTLAARLVRKRRTRGYRSAKMSQTSVRQAATVRIPQLGHSVKRSRRRRVPAEQLRLWSASVAERQLAKFQDVTDQPHGSDVATVGHDRIRQAAIEGILRESATRAAAHGETLKLHRSSAVSNIAETPSSAMKWCDLREQLINEAIDVPPGGWRKRYRRYI